MRAERAGEDLGVHVVGAWTARALPTGRVVLTTKDAAGRLAVIECAETWLDQQRERMGSARFFQHLETQADLRQVLSACGWSL